MHFGTGVLSQSLVINGTAEDQGNGINTFFYDFFADYQIFFTGIIGKSRMRVNPIPN